MSFCILVVSNEKSSFELFCFVLGWFCCDTEYDVCFGWFYHR